MIGCLESVSKILEHTCPLLSEALGEPEILHHTMAVFITAGARDIEGGTATLVERCDASTTIAACH